MTAEYNNLTFVIEEDLPEVGFYLYVYENGKCINDFLQDSLEECKDFALQEFNVPKNSWHRALPRILSHLRQRQK